MEDDKIYLITFEHIDEHDGHTQMLVSHGVGNNTLNNYCLPPDPLYCFPVKYDECGPYIER